MSHVVVVFPRSRQERQYIVAFHTQSASVLDFKDVLVALQIGPGKPENFLLDFADPLYQQFLEAARTQRDSLDLQPAKKARSCKDGSELLATSTPRRIPLGGSGRAPVINQEDAFGLAVKHLPRRQQEAAFYYTFDTRPVESQDTYHDINMSMRFENSKAGSVPCIVCSSSLWSWRWRKHIWGAEAMVLQGFPWTVLKQQAAVNGGWLSHRHLQEMAGNSFNGFALSSIVCCILITFDWADHSSASPPPAISTACIAGSSSSAAVNDDDGSEVSSDDSDSL